MIFAFPNLGNLGRVSVVPYVHSLLSPTPTVFCPDFVPGFLFLQLAGVQWTKHVTYFVLAVVGQGSWHQDLPLREQAMSVP